MTDQPFSGEQLRRVLAAAGTLIRALLIVICLIVVSTPFVFLFLNSLKPPNEFLSTPIKVIPSRIYLEHYRAVFNSHEDTILYLKNSLVITLATTFISVMVGALAAYSLARLNLPLHLTSIIAFTFLVVRFYPKITVALCTCWIRAGRSSSPM